LILPEQSRNLSSESNIQETLKGLAKICKSIKTLRLKFCNNNNNPEAIELIEAQRNLNEVIFTCLTTNDESFCKILEESLIKHEDNKHSGHP